MGRAVFEAYAKDESIQVSTTNIRQGNGAENASEIKKQANHRVFFDESISTGQHRPRAFFVGFELIVLIVADGR